MHAPRGIPLTVSAERPLMAALVAQKMNAGVCMQSSQLPCSPPTEITQQRAAAYTIRRENTSTTTRRSASCCKNKADRGHSKIKVSSAHLRGGGGAVGHRSYMGTKIKIQHVRKAHRDTTCEISFQLGQSPSIYSRQMNLHVAERMRPCS